MSWIDGVALVFDPIDPADRLAVHRFGFLAVYGMEEETLFIDAAINERSTIGG